MAMALTVSASMLDTLRRLETPAWEDLGRPRTVPEGVLESGHLVPIVARRKGTLRLESRAELELARKWVAYWAGVADGAGESEFPSYRHAKGLRRLSDRLDALSPGYLEVGSE